MDIGTGTDGWVYDSFFDYNGNGKLEINEYVDYQRLTYGDTGVGAGTYSRYSGKSCTYQMSVGEILIRLILVILMMACFIFGFMLLIFLPPIGALIMIAGYGIRDLLR